MQTLFIGQFVIVVMYRFEYNLACQEMRDWPGAGGNSQSWDDALLTVCSRQHMLY